jgi:hypothetical protein
MVHLKAGCLPYAQVRLKMDVVEHLTGAVVTCWCQLVQLAGHMMKNPISLSFENGLCIQDR